MKFSIYNALAPVYVEKLTQAEQAELAKYATEVRQAVESQSLEKVATVLHEGLSGLSNADDIENVSRILQFMEDSDLLCKTAGVEKEGSFWDKMHKAAPIVTAGLGLAAAGAGAANVMHKMYKHRAAKKELSKNLGNSLRTIRTDYPHLFVGQNGRDTAKFFSLMSSFSPDIAANPLVAGNIIQRMHRNGASSIDAAQVRDFAEAQHKINESRVDGKLFQDVTSGISDLTKGLTGSYESVLKAKKKSNEYFNPAKQQHKGGI